MKIDRKKLEEAFEKTRKIYEEDKDWKAKEQVLEFILNIGGRTLK